MLGDYNIALEYTGPGSKWAEDHFLESMRNDMMIPTLGQVAEICVEEKMDKHNASFISSTVRLEYDDSGHKLDVYLHIPLQCNSESLDQKRHAFRYPILNPRNVQKLLDGSIKDKNGKPSVFVVDRKSDIDMWKSYSDYFSKNGKYRRKDNMFFRSIEDALKFSSVVAIFAGEQNFMEYAKHYGIENVLFYYPEIISKKKNVRPHFLCLREGNPESYEYRHSAFNSIKMEKDNNPDFDLIDFVIGDPEYANF